MRRGERAQENVIREPSKRNLLPPLLVCCRCGWRRLLDGQQLDRTSGTRTVHLSLTDDLDGRDIWKLHREILFAQLGRSCPQCLVAFNEFCAFGTRRRIKDKVKFGGSSRVLHGGQLDRAAPDQIAGCVSKVFLS